MASTARRPRRAGSFRTSTSRSGRRRFRKAPIGAGPYRFVSFTPGLSWCSRPSTVLAQGPSVKRLVFKSVPDASTRLPCSSARGRLPLRHQRSWRGGAAHAGLTLRHAVRVHPLVSSRISGTRARPGTTGASPGATHAVDRQAVNQAVTLGHSKITAHDSHQLRFYCSRRSPVDNRATKQLLTEAGYPNGFDAGDLWCMYGTYASRSRLSADRRHPDAPGPLERGVHEACTRTRR